MDRSAADDESIRSEVGAIVAAVRKDGDRAVRRFTERFDRVSAGSIAVPPAVLAESLRGLPAPLRAALDRAARNLTTAHRAMMPRPMEVETEPGILLCRTPVPVERVGVYVPGGRAAYPSSVLMGVIPARVAGCREVVVCSPPGADGLPAPVILAASALAGADRVFAVGGAQAIAALAYGTETIPRVDRIVGPGNEYVAQAKLAVANKVGIDNPAGPSELLVVADASASVDGVALELVAQAEHDPRAAVIAVVIGPADLAGRLAAALEARAAETPRSRVVKSALADRGALLTAESLAEAAEFANQYAPEHLLIATASPEADQSLFRIAGATFLGAASSVTFGDYLTGGNHVLPTGGMARSYSGLGTLDFIRWTSEQSVSPAAAMTLATDVALLAAAEGLPAHAAAALAWQPTEVAR